MRNIPYCGVKSTFLHPLRHSVVQTHGGALLLCEHRRLGSRPKPQHQFKLNRDVKYSDLNSKCEKVHLLLFEVAQWSKATGSFWPELSERLLNSSGSSGNNCQTSFFLFFFSLLDKSNSLHAHHVVTASCLLALQKSSVTLARPCLEWQTIFTFKKAPPSKCQLQLGAPFKCHAFYGIFHGTEMK